MILNFFVFTFFLFSLTIFGNFFNHTILKKFNIQIYQNHIFFYLISSLFFLGVIFFFLNFFFPINSAIFNIILLLIFFCALKNVSKIIFKEFKRNIFIIFFVSIITINMKPGYDAGLYHIPFQTWVRDYPIIFGMFNIHERFAHHSIYSYIGATLWFGNYNFLNYLQGSFIIIFIFFLKKLLQTKKLFDVAIVLGTLLSLPVWIRYFDLGYGLVDLAFGLFFFISLIIGVKLLFIDASLNQCLKLNFFYLYLLVLFLFFLKPSGILIFPFFAYICFILLKKKLIPQTIFYNLSILFFLILLLWLLKNLIIFGCLIYGLKFSCFDLAWSNIILVETSLNDISFYKRHFALVSFKNFYLFTKNYLIYLLLSILYIILIYLILRKKFFRQKYFLYFSIIFSFIINFLTYDFSSLKGFTALSTDFPEISKDIIFKEITRLNIILFNSTIITALIFYNFNNKSFFKFNLYIFLIFIYILFILFIWFFKAPDPRFAFGFFSVIPSLIFLTLVNKKLHNAEIGNSKFYFIKAFFYIMLLIYFIFLPLKTLETYSFKFIKVKEINYIKRDGFGVKPNSLIINETNFCWNLKNCYFHEKDIKFNNFLYNHKIALN